MSGILKTGTATNISSALMNIVVPSVSAAILILVRDGTEKKELFAAVCILLLLINIIVFAANEIATLRDIEIQLLRSEREKREMELESYRILYEKYENTRIMRHDLKEQIAALQSIISEDNEEVRKYIKKINSAAKNTDFTEYTNNKILNILFERKLRECESLGIELQIKNSGVDLSFISEIDSVAIFSNLINNAIESCMKSEEKNIFIDIEAVNGAFAAIKTENNSDEAPRIENKTLMTRKNDVSEHGIGMRSIERSIKNYNGKMEWFYDPEKRFFRTVIIFEIATGGTR